MKGPLTIRKIQVACLYALGYQHKELAFILKRCPKTVEKHIHEIYQHFQVNDRFALARRVISQKLMTMDYWLNHQIDVSTAHQLDFKSSSTLEENNDNPATNV